MRIHRVHGIAAYSFLLETDDALFVVDAGMTGQGRQMLRLISRLGRKPEELRLAVITHAHADHFGGLAEIQDVAEFDVAIHPEHAAVLDAGEVILSPPLNPISATYLAFARHYLPLTGMRGARNVTPLEDGARLDEWGLAGRILYTPGHSAGDISLLLDDGSAFVGDTVQGRRIPGIGQPEFPNMAVDMPAVVESWERLLGEGATTFYPAHGTVVTAEDLLPVLARYRERHPSGTASHGGV